MDVDPIPKVSRGHTEGETAKKGAATKRGGKKALNIVLLRARLRACIVPGANRGRGFLETMIVNYIVYCSVLLCSILCGGITSAFSVQRSAASTNSILCSFIEGATRTLKNTKTQKHRRVGKTRRKTMAEQWRDIPFVYVDYTHNTTG